MSLTLLLKISGPMQSWGVSSRFPGTRRTEKQPTKSAIIGMIAASMGRNREDSITDLAGLKFGVRVDQPGFIESDYQLVTLRDKNGVHLANVKGKNISVGPRYYISDGVFLVGLEGDESLLQLIVKSLENPVYPPYLGRKAFVPDQPLIIGIREESLKSALRDHEWVASQWYKDEKGEVGLKILREAEAGESGFFVQDQPVSFSTMTREYSSRKVIMDKAVQVGSSLNEHDPMELL